MFWKKNAKCIVIKDYIYTYFKRVVSIQFHNTLTGAVSFAQKEKAPCGTLVHENVWAARAGWAEQPLVSAAHAWGSRAPTHHSTLLLLTGHSMQVESSRKV